MLAVTTLYRWNSGLTMLSRNGPLDIATWKSAEEEAVSS